MDGIDPDQYGVIGIVVLLLGKMALEYYGRKGRETPADMRQKVLDRLDRILTRLDTCEESVHSMRQKTDAIYDWHKETDSAGVKVWYRGPTDATLARIEEMLQAIERKVGVD